jgi:hypothetical protein
MTRLVNVLLLLFSLIWALFGLLMAGVLYSWGPNNQPGGWALAGPSALIAVAPLGAWLYFNFGSPTPPGRVRRAIAIGWPVFAGMSALAGR